MCYLRVGVVDIRSMPFGQGRQIRRVNNSREFESLVGPTRWTKMALIAKCCFLASFHWVPFHYPFSISIWKVQSFHTFFPPNIGELAGRCRQEVLEAMHRLNFKHPRRSSNLGLPHGKIYENYSPQEVLEATHSLNSKHRWRSSNPGLLHGEV